ncbi:alpha/beta-hydrolase [Lentinula edodes]|nr:alpha/beta-hydrolase [Lentinula edodes]
MGTLKTLQAAMRLVTIPLLTAFLSNLFTPGVQGISERSVSLLFENDGNWENLANRTSALLFSDPETFDDATQVCQDFDENLLNIEGLSDIRDKLSYLRYQGEFNEHTKFWVASNTTGGGSAIAPFAPNSSASNTGSSQKLPFLCSNSAPLTSQVDTDFASLPQTNVTSNGIVFAGVRDHLTFRFMGVPYASSPTGTLRFQYPVPWNGTYVNARGFRPACLQFGSFANNDAGLNPWGISEDCLFLNIYTSYIPSSSTRPASLKPVLFWIHGGGNLNGMGSDETFDGGPLVSRGDVVLVTINYRLNIFGFLGLNDTAIPGNYAMADKIAALRWVKDHIADFGGDPEKVTIFGQSAGGWSIVDLLKSPKAAGLFHAAISQSGGSGTFTTAEEVYKMVVPFLSPLCNETGTELLKCLQGLPANVLLNITNFAGSWSTVIDGIYALDSAVNQMALGSDAVNSVPFMLGFMPEEGQSLLGTTILPNATDFNQSLINTIGSTLAQDVLQSGYWTISEEFDVYNATIDAYTDWFLTCPAENMISAASKSNAFPAMYVYSMQHAYGLSFYDPYELCTFPVGDPQPYYRCHSGDLYEVFGTYHLFSEPLRVPADIFYTNLVQDLWTTFARTGDPNPDLADLAARGPAYESTRRLLVDTKWVWPKYDNVSMQIASLEYPELMTVRGLPDDLDKRCAVITAGSEH